MEIRQQRSAGFVSFCLFFLFVCFTSFALNAAPAADAKKASSETDAAKAELIKQAEALKQDMIELNRELYQFEEDLLHPANTQVALFLAIAPETTFLLDSVELQLDGKLITSYLYKENEIIALRRGGVQRLYLGSLSDGKHKLTAGFNGQGSNARYYRRKKSLTFMKGEDAKFIQLIVTEDPRTREPLFNVKQW